MDSLRLSPYGPLPSDLHILFVYPLFEFHPRSLVLSLIPYRQNISYTPLDIPGSRGPPNFVNEKAASDLFRAAHSHKQHVLDLKL